MDRKVHIHFFPRDASKVRVISFSRVLGFSLLLSVLPLCLLGFWLFFSGILNEDASRKMSRQRLERENLALREKTGALLLAADTLMENIDSLESARLHALMVTGLETPNVNQTESRTFRFRLFRAGSSGRASAVKQLALNLKKAQETSLFFDSSLFVLSQHRELAARFPTALPVGRGALMIRPFGPGPDPFTGRRSLHAGVDFSLRAGAPVFSSGGGTVIAAGNDPLWGNFVRVKHTDRVETFYAHLQEILVHEGETVARGQTLGSLGQSGSATGPHLHYEMVFLGERVDPLQYLYDKAEVVPLL